MKVLDRIVTVVEIGALVCAGVFVVLLFTNDPGSPEVAADADGAAIYAETCASCHGAEGEGGYGPALGDGAVETSFPDVADQIAVIADGRGLMPAFAGDLTADQIEAVAVYEREALGR